MEHRDEKRLLFPVRELAAYKALENSAKTAPASSSGGGAGSDSGMKQIVCYDDGSGMPFPSVGQLTSNFDGEIENAMAIHDVKALENLSEKLLEIKDLVEKDNQNREELKAFVAEYAENRTRLISEAMEAQATREETGQQQSQDTPQQSSEKTPVTLSAPATPTPPPFFASVASASPLSMQIPFSSSSDNTGFSALGDGGERHPVAQQVFKDLFEAVEKGGDTPEKRGEVFSKKLGLPPGVQCSVDFTDKEDELAVSGRGPAVLPIKGLSNVGFAGSTRFQCRVSTGEEPGVKFDLDPDPEEQVAKSKLIAGVAAKLAEQVAKQAGSDIYLGIYDTTGRMNEDTLLGIMDTLKTAGVGYRIEKSLKERFERNQTIRDVDEFSAAAPTSPSLGRSPGR